MCVCMRACLDVGRYVCIEITICICICMVIYILYVFEARSLQVLEQASVFQASSGIATVRKRQASHNNAPNTSAIRTLRLCTKLLGYFEPLG